MPETTLFARQSTTSGSSSTSCPNSLSGGAVAGIVIGSIAGTLLIIWLLKSCFLPGAPGNPDPEKGMPEVVYSTRSGPRRQRRPRNYRSGGGTEYVEYIEQSPVMLSRSRTRRGSVTSVSRPERVYIS